MESIERIKVAPLHALAGRIHEVGLAAFAIYADLYWHLWRELEEPENAKFKAAQRRGDLFSILWRKDLPARCGASMDTVSVALDRLEKAGWLKRVREKGGDRFVFVLGEVAGLSGRLFALQTDRKFPPQPIGISDRNRSEIPTTTDRNFRSTSRQVTGQAKTGNATAETASEEGTAVTVGAIGGRQLRSYIDPADDFLREEIAEIPSGAIFRQESDPVTSKRTAAGDRIRKSLEAKIAANRIADLCYPEVVEAWRGLYREEHEREDPAFAERDRKRHEKAVLIAATEWCDGSAHDIYRYLKWAIAWWAKKRHATQGSKKGSFPSAPYPTLDILLARKREKQGRNYYFNLWRDVGNERQAKAKARDLMELNEGILDIEYVMEMLRAGYFTPEQVGHAILEEGAFFLGFVPREHTPMLQALGVRIKLREEAGGGGGQADYRD